MAATIRIGEREMIDLENRIVLVLVVGGRHNSAVAHSSFLLQNSYPAKLSQVSLIQPLGFGILMPCEPSTTTAQTSNRNTGMK